ncbi:Crp/Fnr family transcriptional regulator [Lachnospiraceae bacterium 62-35]
MDLNFVSKTFLFRGCSEDDVRKIAKYLGFKTVRYKKGTTIYKEGTTVTNIGLVLSGSVQIEHNDFWGNKSVLDIVYPGGIFAEAYACIPNEPLMINVVANANCEILFISIPNLFIPCTVCKIQNRLIQNLMIISAQKNLQLSKRSLHTSPKTIRGRLLSYFSQLISEQGSSKVVSPFNRQQLADYLNLDRSALSKELGKMKNDGLIEYNKNAFHLQTVRKGTLSGQKY